MSDRLVYVLGFIAAAALVFGATYIIGSKGGAIVAGSAPPRAPSDSSTAVAPIAAPPPATPFAGRQEPAQAAPRARRAGSGIFRCVDKGRVTYADQPCGNGREIDVRPTSGFDPVNSPAASTGLPESSRADHGRADSLRTEAESDVDSTHSARCKAIDAEIAWIDEMARKGGNASYQDDLRARRHRLVDEKYRLKC
jgi:hypothetical protein